jgi:hypothetical protein
VKVYLFSTETGLYLGEDFAPECFTIQSRLPLPPGCTCVAPPCYGQGEAPVFLEAESRWEVYPITVAEVKATGKVGPFGVALATGTPGPDADGDR